MPKLPPAPTVPFNTEALTLRILRGPVRRHFVPEEMRLSPWVPQRRSPAGEGESAVYLAAVFYSSPSIAGEPHRIYAPSYVIAVDARLGRLAAFINCAYQNPFSPHILTSNNGLPLLLSEEQPTEGVNIEVFRTKQKRLNTLYDTLLEEFANNRDALPEPSREFVRLLWQLTDPVLEPYLRDLGQTFFAWIEGRHD